MPEITPAHRAYVNDKSLGNSTGGVRVYRIADQRESEVAQAIKDNGHDEVVLRANDGRMYVIQGPSLKVGMTGLGHFPRVGDQIELRDRDGNVGLAGEVINADNELNMTGAAMTLTLIGGLSLVVILTAGVAAVPAAFVGGGAGLGGVVKIAAAASSGLLAGPALGSRQEARAAKNQVPSLADQRSRVSG